MSPQFLELLILAGIAFAIISKLISVLGATEDRSENRESVFGEPGAKGVLKDVTSTGQFSSPNKAMIVVNESENQFIVQENAESVKKMLLEVKLRMPTFNIFKFLRAAKSAFYMIIEAAEKNNNEELALLIDKRYLQEFELVAAGYGAVNDPINLEAKIADIYTFGNNVFIKVLFSGLNITGKIAKLTEEWTFSKRLDNTPNWYLSNVEHAEG